MNAKKQIVVILSLLITSIASLVNADALPPKLSIPSPNFNFETARQGDIVKHDFKIYNAGGSPLVIQRVVPGCGCTATKISTKNVPPGKESVVSVEFNTTGFLGHKVRSISIETNDPKMSVGMLTIEGTIEAEITVEPKALSFGEVKQGSSPSLELIIKKLVNSKTAVREVVSRLPSVTVEKIRNGELESVYRITMKPDAKIGGIRGLVNVVLNDKGATTIPVPVFASIVKNNS